MTNTAPHSLRSRSLPSPPKCRQLRTAALARAPSRGLFPFSVFPASVSDLNPVNSQLTGYVAPPGFRTLSTLCSHRCLPGLFHPGPALGVSLRGFDPQTTPYALSNAESLRVDPLRFCTPERALHLHAIPLSGVRARRPQPSRRPEFSSGTLRSVPPWASSSEVFPTVLPGRSSGERNSRRLNIPSPLALFRLSLHADSSACAPGSLGITLGSLSLERSRPPWFSSPHVDLSSLSEPRLAGS